MHTDFWETHSFSHYQILQAIQRIELPFEIVRTRETINKNLYILMNFVDDFISSFTLFKGTLIDAQVMIKEFLAQLLIHILNVEHDHQIKIHYAIQKHKDVVFGNLKNYFAIHKVPIKKIFTNRVYNDDGFSSSDDEQRVSLSPQKRLRKATTVELSPLQSLQSDKQLNDRLKEKDELIEKMTIGYLKDVQHLREMFVRKELYPDWEIFDVNFYDYTQSLDPTVKEFIKGKLLELTNSFKVQIQRCNHTIQEQQKEIDRHKQLIKQLASQSDVNSILKQLLYFEKDLNKIWRGIQDCIGNQAVFDIFEKRKAGYGIDYQQIDKLIASSQAQHRLYQQYKDNLDSQMIQFTAATKQELSFLARKTEQLQQQLEELKSEKETDVIQLRQTIKASIEQIYEIKIQAIKEKYNQNLREYVEGIIDKRQLNVISNCMKSLVFVKWLYMAKCYKFARVNRVPKRSISETQLKIINQVCLEDPQIRDLKYRNKDLEEICLEEQTQKSQFLAQLQILSHKLVNLKQNFEMQSQRINYQSQHISQLESMNKYFDKIFTMILKKVGYGHLEVSLKNSKMLLESADAQIRHFQDNLDKLDIDQFQNIKDASLYLVKRQLIHKKLFGDQEYQEAYTITDIFDVKRELNNQSTQRIEQHQQTELTVCEHEELILNEPTSQVPIPTIWAESQAEEHHERTFERELFISEIDNQPSSSLHQGVVSKSSPKTFTFDEYYTQFQNLTQKTDQLKDFTKCSGPQETIDSGKSGPRYVMTKSLKQGGTQKHRKASLVPQNNLENGLKPQTRSAYVQTELTLLKASPLSQEVNNFSGLMISTLKELQKNTASQASQSRPKFSAQKRPETQQTFASFLTKQNIQKLQFQKQLVMKRKQSSPDHYYAFGRASPIHNQRKLKTEKNGSSAVKTKNLTFSIETAQIYINNEKMFLSAKNSAHTPQIKKRSYSKAY